MTINHANATFADLPDGMPNKGVVTIALAVIPDFNILLVKDETFLLLVLLNT